MRRRPSPSFRLFVLIVGLGCIATPVAAQHRVAGPRASDVWAPSATSAARVAAAATIPDTVRQRSTHWREGALFGAIAGAVAGGWLASHLCALTSEGAGSCGGAALGGAAVFATGAGALGALVGALIPKRAEPPRPSGDHGDAAPASPRDQAGT